MCWHWKWMNWVSRFHDSEEPIHYTQRSTHSSLLCYWSNPGTFHCPPTAQAYNCYSSVQWVPMPLTHTLQCLDCCCFRLCFLYMQIKLPSYWFLARISVQLNSLSVKCWPMRWHKRKGKEWNALFFISISLLALKYNEIKYMLISGYNPGYVNSILCKIYITIRGVRTIPWNPLSTQEFHIKCTYYILCI